MKKNKILSAFFLLTMGFMTTGCEEFLDREPLSATLDDYGSVIDGQAVGLYAIFNTYAGFNSLPWIDMHSIRDDDAQKGSSTTDGAEIIAEFETFQYTKDDWATNTYWNDHYYMINQANKLLADADSLELKDDAALRNIGEAHFFRAYAYFELVNAYGEVPKIDFFYTVASDGIRPKSSTEEIYALIDADLQEAVNLLPDTWFNSTTNQNPFPGRLTRGAANALWAKSHLYRKNWDMASQKCDSVILSAQYSLLPSFREVWRDGVGGVGKNSKESVLEMQAFVGAGGTPDLGAQYATSQNVRQGGAAPEWNLGWGWNCPTDKLEGAWDDSDPRKRMTILYSGEYDGGDAEGGYGATLPPYNPGAALDQKYWSKKVYSDPAMRQFTGNVTNGNAGWINHRIIRYADILLMKAEAANELGDGATAATLLEEVRARARGGNSSVLPEIQFTNVAAMRTAIKNERRWEFAMEGLRFYDLVRWGDANAALGSLGYTDRCKWYPIPQRAIDLSGGVLTQNPAW